MKKTFDAVAMMREAREQLSGKWKDKPRKEEIESLRRKFGRSVEKRKRVSR